MDNEIPGTHKSAPGLASLAVVLALLPVAAINAAYVLAMNFETVPSCMPYLDGCTSISSTGRTSPSVWVFKPLMLVTAGLMAWFFARAGAATGRASMRDTVALCGLIAAAALVLYIIFLGTEGLVYGLLRRYGVTLYFGFTYLAQLLLAKRLLAQVKEPARTHARWMLLVCILLLAIGLGSIPVSNFVADKDQIENIIEWNFALLMQLNFLLAGAALAGLQARFRQTNN